MRRGTTYTTVRVALLVAAVFALAAGPVAATPRPPTRTVTWAGKGTTAGALNVSVCGTANGAPVDGAYLVFVLASTPGVSSAEIRFGSGDSWHAMTKSNGTRTGTSSYKYRWTGPGPVDLATILDLPVQAQWTGSDSATPAATLLPTLTIGQGCLTGPASGCTAAPANTSPPVVGAWVNVIAYFSVAGHGSEYGGSEGTWTTGTGTCTILSTTYQWQWSSNPDAVTPVWTNGTAATATNADFAWFTDPADSCSVYWRAQVTKTNESGPTTANSGPVQGGASCS